MFLEVFNTVDHSILLTKSQAKIFPVCFSYLFSRKDFAQVDKTNSTDPKLITRQGCKERSSDLILLYKDII